MHREQDEFIDTLDGRFRVRLGDDLIGVLPRSFVFIPRKTAHTWQNVGAGYSRFVATLTPASVELEVFFHRYGELSPEERGIDAFSLLAAETGAMEVLGRRSHSQTHADRGSLAKPSRPWPSGPLECGPAGFLASPPVARMCASLRQTSVPYVTRSWIRETLWMTR